MRITFDGEKYVTNLIPPGTEAAWTTDPLTNQCYTYDPRAVAGFRSYCSDRAKKELSRTFLERTPWPTPPPHPPHLTPRFYQTESALFALQQNRSYMGLCAGLGKTIVAALIQNAMQGAMVYVCPPYLTLTVQEEFKKWMTAPTKITTSLEFYPRQFPCVWIIPSSRIHDPHIRTQIGKFLLAHNVHTKNVCTLVIDEAHQYSHLEARRTRALFQALVPAFPHVVFMSGTPMPSRPMELWPVLSECAPETIDFMTMESYGQKFCGGHYVEGRGWDFSRASNVELLAKKIHGTFMYRVRKADVLKDLPPKTEELVFIGEDLPPDLAAIDMAILRHKSPEDLVGKALATAAKLEEGQELPLSTYRRELEKLKVKAAVKFIRGVLEDGDENLLVFGYHKEAMAELEKGLADFSPLVVTGQTPLDERHRLVKTFQQGGHRIFLGNYLAAGTGFTLTKATRVIFVSFSWVPAENDQAADRCHRIGQKGNVLVQYLVYKNSVDRQVLEVIQKKRKSTRYI